MIHTYSCGSLAASFRPGVKPPVRNLILGAILSAVLVFANGATGAERSLGGFPVCEASAALMVPCPEDAERSCVLIADNEQKEKLFLFKLEEDSGAIRLQKASEPALKRLKSDGTMAAFKISDIEALVRLRSGEVIAYGSHSRNTKCELKKKRRIFAQGSLVSGTFRVDARQPVESDRHTCKRLFLDNSDDVLNAVCTVIERAENAADAAAGLSAETKRKEACSEDPVFNLEGAAAILSGGQNGRVWVGLRAPLVGRKAVLLRQVQERNAFRFDAAVLLDLGGFGVRDLSYHDGRLWGIAGPATDESVAHDLWFIDANDLTPGATLNPVVVDQLPIFAEGLTVLDGHIIVVTDGAEPEVEGREVCDADSTYVIRTLP